MNPRSPLRPYGRQYPINTVLDLTKFLQQQPSSGAQTDLSTPQTTVGAAPIDLGTTTPGMGSTTPMGTSTPMSTSTPNSSPLIIDKKKKMASQMLTPELLRRLGF